MNKKQHQSNYPVATDSTYAEVRNYIIDAQKQVAHAVNSAMVIAYWQIGKKIYEICKENPRAAYGERIVQGLSQKLTKEFGAGYSKPNLWNMRQFYLAFPKLSTVCRELSWSHYRLLMRISNSKARTFYAEESAKDCWSVRQLERQIVSCYYERMLSSKTPKRKKTLDTEPKPEYEKIVKDPYVLEFLDLPANDRFYESDVEQALIDHLQKFLLELGRGYCFVGRQKHFEIDGDHFYIDLVFYNYIMKCFVLIDLKTGTLTHQDLGQMQMYVNYYTREMMNEGDNPPIGIVLCADKNDSMVKFTLPEDNTQIYAAEWSACLPSEEEFKKELNLENFVKKEK